MQDQIPKRIIQTGKSRDLQVRDRAAVCNLQLLNPDFEYLFFDNAQVESFIDGEFPQYRATFDSFKFRIQRYDFFRYLAVYHFGGFYFDLDVFLAQGLSSLLEAKAVFPFEGLTLSDLLREQGVDWQIGNYAFGAAPAHPFLRLVIENCVRAQKEPDWVKPMMRGVPRLSRDEFLVLHTTGPGLLTRTLVENPTFADTVTVLFAGDDVCDARNWNCFGDIGIHLMNGSWRAQNGFLRRRLANYWEVSRLKTVLKESRKLGKTRTFARTRSET